MHTFTQLAFVLFSVEATGFGSPFEIPKIPSGTNFGFTPGPELDVQFVQYSPGNPKSIVKTTSAGVSLTLERQGGGASIRTVQAFNEGAACFVLQNIGTEWGGVASTAYTINVHSTCYDGNCQDGKSDEVDIEFAFGNSVRFQTNAWKQGAGGKLLFFNPGHEATHFTVTPDEPHLYCIVYQGQTSTWFVDGKELKDGQNAPLHIELTQQRHFWFSIWECGDYSTTNFCLGNSGQAPSYTQQISGFSFFQAQGSELKTQGSGDNSELTSSSLNSTEMTGKDEGGGNDSNGTSKCIRGIPLENANEICHDRKDSCVNAAFTPFDVLKYGPGYTTSSCNSDDDCCTSCCSNFKCVAPDSLSAGNTCMSGLHPVWGENGSFKFVKNSLSRRRLRS